MIYITFSKYFTDKGLCDGENIYINPGRIDDMVDLMNTLEHEMLHQAINTSNEDMLEFQEHEIIYRMLYHDPE